jgi:hypothetical protein
VNGVYECMFIYKQRHDICESLIFDILHYGVLWLDCSH